MSSSASPAAIRVGLDFGTTNSVVVVQSGHASTQTLRFSFPGQYPVETCRTLLCLWQEHSNGRLNRLDAIGAEAIEAYLDDPSESRLIMSMKTYLAQKSFRETRILGQTLTLEDMIALFLRRVMENLGFAPGQSHVTVGRPVHFAGERADDAFGEERLRTSLTKAGFKAVSIALEPEAAGWRFARRLTQPATVLVGDFGGGTSDFSILKLNPQASGAATALGYAGVGLAGDQLDYRIIDNVIAPHLGKACTYRVMGGSPLPVPAEWFAKLGRWHQLSMMRTPQVLRDIADVARTASDPHKLHALMSIIEDQQAQALYAAVGKAKRELSSSSDTVLRFAHKSLVIEEKISREDFESWIAPDLACFDQAVKTALTQASLEPEQIDHVFLTGGTSFVPAVRQIFTARFGADKIDRGGEFVSVAEGLALMDA